MRLCWFKLGIPVLGLILAACAVTVAPAQPISTTNSAEALAIAIETNGTRHLVWKECPSNGGCSLVYVRTLLSGTETRITLNPTNNETFGEPDIAVDSLGKAYLVWNSYVSTLNRSTPMYASIPANSNAVPSATALGTWSTGNLLRSRVVAGNSSAYAVYYVVDPNDNSRDLYQRRLNPLNNSVALATSTNAQVSNVVPALDSNGSLHVAYEYTALNNAGYQAIFYQGNNGLNMIENTSMMNDAYGPPDLAITDTGAAYVTYTRLTDRRIILSRHIMGSSVSNSQIPFDPAYDPWYPFSDPKIAPRDTGAVITFVADNASLSSAEVWLFKTADLTLTRLSSTIDAYPIGPQIANVAGYPVVTWRVEPNAHVGCPNDAYIWNQGNGVRKIQTSYEFACGGLIDLAARGDWIVGAAIDPNAQGKNVPWVAFNQASQ